MSPGSDEVEFLDLDGEDGESAREVLWLDDVGADGQAAPDDPDVQWLEDEAVGDDRPLRRDPLRLPPIASRGRVLLSLATAALLLAGTGTAAAAAYHRHEDAVRVANTLSLRVAGTGPTLPNLGDLSFQSVWHAYPRAKVTVPVTNAGADTVTLLDATLSQPGLVADAALKPAGDPVLRPGQVGELTGTVAADCTVAGDAMNGLYYHSGAGFAPYPGSIGGAVPGTGSSTTSIPYPGSGSGQSDQSSVSGTPSGPGISGLQAGPVQNQDPDTATLVYGGGPVIAQADRPARPTGVLKIHARAEGGRTDYVPLTVESSTGMLNSLICDQQGDDVAALASVSASATARSRAVDLQASISSLADVPMQYLALAEFDSTNTDQALASSVSIASEAESGSVDELGVISVQIDVPLGTCPSTALREGQDFGTIELMYIVNGQAFTLRNYTVPIDAAVDKACGL